MISVYRSLDLINHYFCQVSNKLKVEVKVEVKDGDGR